MTMLTCAVGKASPKQIALVQQCLTEAKKALSNSLDYKDMNARKAEILAQLPIDERKILEAISQADELCVFRAGITMERALN
ncbi:hypothetical protein HB818_14175 [Listeria booriae]|uniref:hypothetical protein n=1 Tax=Listeria booriae TaxID=1552123 RepID=UPI001628FE3D|nr:hypothetical protein [Listeria booriae]MBC1286906.1 hypothetical protein [Listeria booriae]